MITLENWKSEVEKLKLQENLTWNEILPKFKDVFPQLNERQLYEKLRQPLKGKSAPTKTVDIENNDQLQNPKITFKENGEYVFEGIIKLLSGEKITPQIIMKAHNLKCEEWKVVSFTSNAWQSQVSGGDKITLWQSKITVCPTKKDLENLTMQDVSNHFKEHCKNYRCDTVKPLNDTVKNNKKSNKMYEVNIADLHFAKLAWKPECGENYDIKIAKERFLKIINKECERLESLNVEKILFVWTNDFFHVDNPQSTTFGNTPQDTDIRWQKMFLLGCEALVEAVDKLQQFAKVETFYIASNHSRTIEFYAIQYLRAWFKDNNRVEVSDNCKTRYYYSYGVNLIGFTHGYYEKEKQLLSLMSIEVPELWAKSKYREYHLAHYHSEQVKEVNGIVFRWLPSVTGTDAWHYQSGYVGATKRSYSFLWDKENGLEQINVTHIKED